MDAAAIQQLPPEHQQLVLEAEQKFLQAKQNGPFLTELEFFADTLDKVGMHDEARKYLGEISSSANDILTQARCWRKIAFSFNSQRDFGNAGIAAEKSIMLIRQLPLKEKAEKAEYVKILYDAANSFYFQLKFEKLEAIAKEVKRFLPDLADTELRAHLFNIINLSLFGKSRWYKFPEEVFTHSELQLQLTRELEDKYHYAFAHCGAGFFYLWNEEVTVSRDYFAKAIQLLDGKYFHALLMAYNYTAVGYRMQNNISMTEQWAHLTLEKAMQSSNLSYVPTSYANLAWVYAKRNNWLYAEEYARKAKDSWTNLGLPFFYAFPLMNCLLLKKETEEAGQLAFICLHPRVKRLPDSLTEKLQSVVRAWADDNKNKLLVCLEDSIDEAKLTGYY